MRCQRARGEPAYRRRRARRCPARRHAWSRRAQRVGDRGGARCSHRRPARCTEDTRRPTERRCRALFCPGPVRDNPALGEEVNERLVDWAEEVAIYPDELDQLRACNFGRLIMLAHPRRTTRTGSLAATKCVVAEWAADDYYVDEVALGADPRSSAHGWRSSTRSSTPRPAAGALCPRAGRLPARGADRHGVSQRHGASEPLRLDDAARVAFNIRWRSCSWRGIRRPTGTATGGRRRSGSTSCNATSTATCRR